MAREKLLKPAVKTQAIWPYMVHQFGIAIGLRQAISIQHMKTMRVLVVLSGLMFAAGSGWAQAIQFVSVQRQARYVQQGALVTDRIVDPITAFVFRGQIEGNMTTTATNIISGQPTYSFPGALTGSLAFNINNNGWDLTDTTQPSMTALNTAYGNGTYTFTAVGAIGFTGGSASVNVSDATFTGSTLNIPLLTLSGGSWVGSSYVISNLATLTINFNAAYTGTPASTKAFHFDAGISGMGFINGPNGFANYDPLTSTMIPGVTGPATWMPIISGLTAGSYTIDVSYDDVQSPLLIGVGAGTALNGAFSASILEYRTAINLQVIPEPSTYAAILSAVALGGVMLHRRRAARAN